METTDTREHGPVKAKKGAVSPSVDSTHPRSSAPTKFVLKSEKELERSLQQRGRKMSRSSGVVHPQEDAQSTPIASMMGDSSFGVQSLEETICSTFPSNDISLSRTISNGSERSSTADDRPQEATDDGAVNIGRKRRAPNRVHPTIFATGQRLISSERKPHTCASPASAAQSPLANRRGSNTSSIHMESRPLTPLRLSPHPESVPASTPRSGSPKSFRLSDEESVDGTSSQVIMSSNGDEEEDQHMERPPQLVMPSLSVPLRRPFTEQGRRIGRSRIMVLGRSGVGKTSFINSLYRCEHIVHMDGISNSLSQLSTNTVSSAPPPSYEFVETHASTRPYPSWWTDLDSRRALPRRTSIGESILERNLTFVEGPSLDNDDQVHLVFNHLKLAMGRTANIGTMNDSEVIGMLSGDGGVQIDAAIYLFDSTPSPCPDSSDLELSTAHKELLQCLSKWTNLIPVITRSDIVTEELLELRRSQICSMLTHIKAEAYTILSPQQFPLAMLQSPPAVSFAPGEDSEIDASVLMSSQYLPPLVASDLGRLVHGLLAPDNVARMRHLSAIKVLSWSRENVVQQSRPSERLLLVSPYLRSESPGMTSNGSFLDEPSKVLVPHSSSSYYRSASPATSDISGNNALAHRTQQAHPTEPFRQVRLAKWAQDLQRSLANERRKYTEMYNSIRPSEWDKESDNKKMALTRPGRGRLGGEIGVIDPRDPLGVLSFGRQGLLLLKVVGSCGLIGAAVYWIMKNWTEVQEFLGWGPGPSTQPNLISTTAVPAPHSQPRLPVLGWIDEQYLRGFFGWR